MSQMKDLIGLDNEKLSSHWGFSRRGMHNGVVDAKEFGRAGWAADTATTPSTRSMPNQSTNREKEVLRT